MTTTALSAGAIIYKMLSGSEELSAKVTKVFPLVVNSATLPYVAYRRADLQHTTAKSQGADTVTYEVNCYAATYDESIEIAELVRSALDYRTGTIDDLTFIACYLSGAQEVWENDAFVQQLTFTIKIG